MNQRNRSNSIQKTIAILLSVALLWVPFRQQPSQATAVSRWKLRAQDKNNRQLRRANGGKWNLFGYDYHGKRHEEQNCYKSFRAGYQRIHYRKCRWWRNHEDLRICWGWNSFQRDWCCRKLQDLRVWQSKQANSNQLFWCGRCAGTADRVFLWYWR